MVKTKHKPAATVISKSNDSQSSSHNSPNIAVDTDLPDEDSWVMVKKQKVNILIPRLPSCEQNLDHSQGQLNVDIPTITDVPSRPPQLSPQKPHETSLPEINDNDIPLSPKSDSQLGKEVHTTQDKEASNPQLSRKNNFEDQDGVLKPLCRSKKSLLKFNDKVHKPSRANAQKTVDSPGCTKTLNKTMRASNLKIKIARTGGLHRWLSSLGLEQFEGIFHGKNISKFLVANLSMNKLKDMGYHAVGPRRKLIHAIECPFRYCM